MITLEHFYRTILEPMMQIQGFTSLRYAFSTAAHINAIDLDLWRAANA